MRDFTFRTVPLVILAVLQVIMMYAGYSHSPIRDLLMIYGIAYAITMVFEPLLIGIIDFFTDFMIHVLNQLTTQNESDIDDSKEGVTHD